MRTGLLTTIATCFVFALCAAPAPAQTAQLTPFGGQTYASPRHVTGEPADPNRVFVAEAEGTIRLVEGGATDPTPFLDISAEVCSSADGCGGESGLFSMALAPDYAASGLLYVYFTRDVTPETHELVIREFDSSSNPDDVDESTGRDVLVIPHPTNQNHNGGQLQFGPDGYLYAATGDGGGGNDPDNNAQNLNSLLGKMLRIDPADPAGGADYSVPPDNPFAGTTPGADEIYAYGLRNPYRFSFDRLTGDLTIGDVGQGAFEEIDFASNGTGLGANFGWDCFEGTAAGASSGQPQCNPLQDTHLPPVLQYARPLTGAAVNGGFIVRDLTVPSLLGRYVYGDSSGALPGNAIFSALLFDGGSSGNGPTGLSAPFIVSFGEDACGHVYVVSGSAAGQVSRIEPAGGSPACSPQTAVDSPPLGNTTPLGDTTPPTLSVDVSKARRAAKHGAVRLVVGCDEACLVSGEGEVTKQGKDPGLDPGSEQLAAGVPEVLVLELSGKEARRLRRALKRGSNARAVVDLLASDAAGNRVTASRRVKQKG